jgi:geranylgeranyl diphosphate synthase type II
MIAPGSPTIPAASVSIPVSRADLGRPATVPVPASHDAAPAPAPARPQLDADESAAFEAALAAAVDPRRPLGPVLAAGVRGGHRLRPLMVREAFLAVRAADRAAGQAHATDDAAWIAAAVGAELVHSASLAHDDLPEFDDADERRGQPTLHVQAGVPAAILAGDALLAAGFGVLARGLPGPAVAPATDLMARAIGIMCRGQQEDLTAGSALVRRRANARKSGVLFAVSGALGVLAAGRPADDPLVGRMLGLGMRLGKAYQAVDDVRDGDGDARAVAGQLRALDRRLGTLPVMPRVEAVIRLFVDAARRPAGA